MQNKSKYKKITEIIVGIIFLTFTILFFIMKQYWHSLLLLSFFIPLLRIDELKRFILSRSKIEAEFEIPEEKIKEDIKENKRPINKETFANFKKIEEQVLKDVYQKIGGEMKKEIRYMYGILEKPEFVFIPDATISTEKELIFLEIKYILKPEFVEAIVKRSLNYLEKISNKFSPVAGKKLKIKLILASAYNINVKSFIVPEGIEIEFYKL